MKRKNEVLAEGRGDGVRVQAGKAGKAACLLCPELYLQCCTPEGWLERGPGEADPVFLELGWSVRAVGRVSSLSPVCLPGPPVSLARLCTSGSS